MIMNVLCYRSCVTADPGALKNAYSTLWELGSIEHISSNTSNNLWGKTVNI